MSITNVIRRSFDTDVAIDLETTGKEPGCGILSIGASTLDGKCKFYVSVDNLTNEEVGLKSDPDTLLWWKRQSFDAYSAAWSGTRTIKDALLDFYEWYKQFSNGDVWGNGVLFDNAILMAAYKACELEVPWSYKQDKCYRTLKGLSIAPPAPNFSGTRHNALADAIHQATHCHMILTRLANIAAATVAFPDEERY